MSKRNQIVSVNNEGGFTLIEILIAMAIFAVGFLAVAAMQVAVVKNTKVGNTHSQALALAQAKMEEIKNSDIKDALLTPTGSIPAKDSGLLDENGNTGTGGIYTRSWTVAQYVENKGTANARVIDDAREVTVTVTFPFAMSGNKEVSITSVVTGGGI